MKEQIARARFYYNLVEQGISRLDKASHWPVSIYLHTIETPT